MTPFLILVVIALLCFVASLVTHPNVLCAVGGILLAVALLIGRTS